MAYRRLSERKAEQERAALERDWMTLAEAIDLIERVDAERGIKAPPPPFDQICDAMADGELRARWLDQGRPLYPQRHTGDEPILDNPLHYIAQIRTRRWRIKNGGEIDWGGGWWRQLLLLRQDIARFSPGTTVQIQDFRRLSKNKEGEKIINDAIFTMYDLADAQGIKPPNIKEIVQLTLRYLKQRGIIAPGRWIEELAANDQHRRRRAEPGKHSGLRPISELKF